jgi:hypothetical protein
MKTNNSAPCKFVSTVPPGFVSAINKGRAKKLTVGGHPVILETLAGDTDGEVGGMTPQTLLNGVAKQSSLTAV